MPPETHASTSTSSSTSTFQDLKSRLHRTVIDRLNLESLQALDREAAASHDMAIAAHRLNMLAAFFFPIATLSAVFDTSLRHPLEQYIPAPYAFYSVIGLGLFLGVALAGFLAEKAPAARRL